MLVIIQVCPETSVSNYHYSLHNNPVLIITYSVNTFTTVPDARDISYKYIFL
jgi:hypothetical protein